MEVEATLKKMLGQDLLMRQQGNCLEATESMIKGSLARGRTKLGTLDNKDAVLEGLKTVGFQNENVFSQA